MSEPIDVLDAVVRELEAGRRAALCAIVATRGSTPQPPGTIVSVDEAAQLTGTLGGGCVEADVRRQAHQLLQADSGKLLTFVLDEDLGYDDGMICGGAMDIAIALPCGEPAIGAIKRAATQLRTETVADLSLRVIADGGPVEFRLTLESTPSLLIAGAGHIGRVIAGFGAALGFNVTIVDDRPDFANAKRLPEKVSPVVGDIAGTLSEWPIDANTYVVIVTRGHKHDAKALEAVLPSSAKYIGMIGSRRKIELVFDELLERGASREALDRVRAPIGIDIGSVTAPEIAASIAAELVAVRRAERRVIVEGPLPVSDDSI